MKEAYDILQQFEDGQLSEEKTRSALANVKPELDSWWIDEAIQVSSGKGDVIGA